MTSRERAVKALTGMPVERLDPMCGDIGAEGARWVVKYLESVGLAVIDAETHRLCVDAVRARAWFDGEVAAHEWIMGLMESDGYLVDVVIRRWKDRSAAEQKAVVAHGRAIAALEKDEA